MRTLERIVVVVAAGILGACKKEPPVPAHVPAPIASVAPKAA